MKPSLLVGLLFVMPVWMTSAQVGAPEVLARRGAGQGVSLDRGTSGAAVLSADGKFVVFVSSSQQLTPQRSGGPYLNVFVRDLGAGTLKLASVATNGLTGNGISINPALSDGHQHVAFESSASNLVSQDTNGVADIFVRALDTGTTRLVSVSTAGVLADGASSEPSISADGNLVAFTSVASNLVNGDTNRCSDVFVRDVKAGSTTLLSATSAGLAGQAASAHPKITPDGKYVVFTSRATNLVGTSGSFLGDVYVRYLPGKATAWAGVHVQSLLATVTSSAEKRVVCQSPLISDAGRYVVFRAVSYAGPVLVIRYDLTTGVSDLVSSNSIGSVSWSDDGGGVAMSSSGRYVAFVVKTNTPAHTQVFVWDGTTRTSTPVSLNNLGALPTNGDSLNPFISGGGRYVGFASSAGILSSSAAGQWELYLRDMTNNTTATVATALAGGLFIDSVGTVSSDGRYVAYEALVERGVSRVFLADMNQSSATTALSEPDPSVIPMAGSGGSSVEPGGWAGGVGRVAFSGTIEDAVPGDTNQLSDVFVRDLAGGTQVLVSAALDGSGGGNGWSGGAVTSADGQRVVFVSAASNLVAGDANAATDVFLRDLGAGTTTLLSLHRSGAGSGNGASWAPSMSSDGRYVVFLTTATNLTSTVVTGVRTNVVLWDGATGSRALLTTDGSDVPPVISADGTRVVYQSGTVNGRVLAQYRTDTGTKISLGPYSVKVSPLALSANGNFVAGRRPDGVAVWNLADQSVRVLAVASGEPSGVWRQALAVSDDARWVLFTSQTFAARLGYTTTVPQAFLHDFQTGMTTIVSMGAVDHALGDDLTDTVSMSRDAGWLVFRSWAGNLEPGCAVGQPNIFVVERGTGRRWLASQSLLGPYAGTGWHGSSGVTADGRYLYWRTTAADEAEGDRSGAGHVLWAALTPTSVVDVDGDGMEDGWEQRYFGGLQRDGTGDSDQDGLSDGEEYRAGTDPTNAASSLRLQFEVAGGGVRLSWGAVLGRGYLVQYQDELSEQGWRDLPGGWIAGGVGVLVDGAVVGQRFYRLKLVE